MIILQGLLSVILFIPHSIFIGMLALSKKVEAITVGRAADVTTVALLISVPLALEALTGKKLGFALFSLLIIIAMYSTIKVWRTEKDIPILKLSRKIWRIYFVLLSMLYVIAMLVGTFYHSVSN